MWLSSTESINKQSKKPAVPATCFHSSFLLGLFFNPCRWHVLQKRRSILNGLHRIRKQKTEFSVLKSFRYWNCWCLRYWNIESCNPTFRWNMSPPYSAKQGINKVLFYADFLLGLFFGPEDRSVLCFRNDVTPQKVWLCIQNMWLEEWK
jgi:hypothetical protein